MRVCARACVCACVRACLHVCVRACVRACVCASWWTPVRHSGGLQNGNRHGLRAEMIVGMPTIISAPDAHPERNFGRKNSV